MVTDPNPLGLRFTGAAVRHEARRRAAAGDEGEQKREGLRKRGGAPPPVFVRLWRRTPGYMSTIDRRDVTVTYDASCGYIASAPELRQPIVALSLGGLRRRVEALLLPDDVVLQLDGLAERERHRRRAKMGVTAGRARGLSVLTE